MVKEVFPSTRGLTEEEISGKKKDPELEKLKEWLETLPEEPAVFDIKEVVEFKPGFLKVRLTNGKIQDRKGGTIAWRNNNPGNLKHGAFAKEAGSVGSGHGGHAVFPNYQKGLEAQKKLLFTDVRGYNELTILKAMQKYAPVSDPNFKNEPTKYAMFIAKQLGVSTETVLSSLNEEQQTKMIEAMSTYEGWKAGTVE